MELSGVVCKAKMSERKIDGLVFNFFFETQPIFTFLNLNKVHYN